MLGATKALSVSSLHPSKLPIRYCSDMTFLAGALPAFSDIPSMRKNMILCCPKALQVSSTRLLMVQFGGAECSHLGHWGLCPGGHGGCPQGWGEVHNSALEAARQVFPLCQIVTFCGICGIFVGFLMGNWERTKQVCSGAVNPGGSCPTPSNLNSCSWPPTHSCRAGWRAGRSTAG